MSDDDGRLVSGRRRPDERENVALRPKLLRELIGQDRVREQLKIIIEAAMARKEPVDHILFYGPPGLGKTSLAHVIANEMAANVHITAGPSIERSGDLAAILTHMKQGDILFIDEIHRLGRAVEEILYPAMEDFALDIVIGKGPAAKNMRLNLPRFTVIGATTQLALLAGPLRDRFGARFRLDYYDQPAMEQIIERAARMLKIEITPEGLSEIARRSRGTPRVGLRLLRRARDYAQTRAEGVITGPVAGESLELQGIDFLGLGRHRPPHPQDDHRQLRGRPGRFADDSRLDQRGQFDHRGRVRTLSDAARLSQTHSPRASRHSSRLRTHRYPV